MAETILPHQMPHALRHAPDTLRVLSLDCFDTLLWRDCHAPTDLFAALPQLSVGQRIIGEQQARKVESVLHRRSEVSLQDIYQQVMPNASQAEREQAISEELQAEAQTCFAFKPTVDLMRAAKAGGAKVIIVSDTYLTSKELEQLIRLAAGDEVADLIDRVFASSQEGLSKSQGMFAKVLKAMKCKPYELLHIGDNRNADFHGARSFNIPALHLDQFGEQAVRRFRFERSCQQLIGDVENGVRGLMPHRAIMAREEPQISDPAKALGFTVLGPVFHGFDRWLRQEAQTLQKERGGTVHWLFMLRDGHLPHLVHQIAGEAPSTARVEISRFTAIAASLTNKAAYQQLFASEYGLNPGTLARQMLFDEDEIEQICRNAKSEAELAGAVERLRKEATKGQREKLTFRRARGRAERLIEHVRSAVNPQPGDTLMLVDLGYNGSAQDRIDPILSEALDVHIAGRYLLLREMVVSGFDKKGMIDARNFDAEMLEAMCGNVAVLEQLSTCEMGSVTDYQSDGEPIRKASSVKGAQSDVRDKVQQGVVDFAKGASDNPVIRAVDHHQERGWRDTALASLFRFMFLPDGRELDVVKSFEHDVNLGSDRMVALFDEAHATEGMRRRGLFYMKGSARMFLPAELAREDMSTRLSLLVQKRFGLGLSYSDNVGRSIALPAIYLSKDESAQTSLTAFPTHEGFYTARLPIVAGAMGIAVQFGAVFEWFELAGISLTCVESLQGDSDNDRTPRQLPAQYDGLVAHGSGLLEASEAAAFLLVNPPAQSEEDPAQMIELTFRPIRYRNGKPNISSPLADAPKDAAA